MWSEETLRKVVGGQYGEVGFAMSIRMILIRRFDRKPKSECDDGRTHHIAERLDAVRNESKRVTQEADQAFHNGKRQINGDAHERRTNAPPDCQFCRLCFERHAFSMNTGRQRRDVARRKRLRMSFCHMAG